ncbi:MAG: hypothetical protein K0U98_01145 [Deltaproteobacteria bacterium]|nr:hypothetical protein [Deltaproteobacteria bacterium]
MFERPILSSQWILGVLLISLGPVVWAGSTVPFEGFNHTPLGSAQLVLVGDRLEVSNFGGAGTDGVRVETLAAEGMASRLGIDTIDILRTAKLTAAAVGLVDGTEVTAMELEIEFEPTTGQFKLTPDFSALGASTYSFELYLGDTQVGCMKKLSVPAGSFLWPANLEPELFVHRGGALGLYGFPDKGAGGGFRLPDGTIVDADSAVFVAEDATSDADFFSALELTATGVNSFYLAQHDVVMWNNRHRALEGFLVPASDSLTLQGLPPTAGPGLGSTATLEVELGEALSWFVGIEDLSPLELLDGATLEARTFGTVDGEVDQDALATRIEFTGSEFQASFDFSPLSTLVDPVPYLVPIGLEIFNGEVSQGTWTNLENPVATFAEAPAILDPVIPSSFPPDPFPGDEPLANGDLPLVELTFDSPVAISIPGRSSPFTGDRIFAWPDFDPKAVTSAARFRIQTTGIPAVSFASEVVGHYEKAAAVLANQVEGWIINCQDELEPKEKVKSYLCLVNDSPTIDLRGVYVTGDPMGDLRGVAGIDLADQQDGTYRNTDPITLFARSHCTVGLQGEVAVKSGEFVIMDYLIEVGPNRSQVRDVDQVVAGSQVPPQHGFFPPDCLHPCAPIPIVHQCPTEQLPELEAIFADGFESGDASAWTAIH